MKANELMIGDYILYEYQDKMFPARILEIYHKSLLVEEHSHEYEPIEIEQNKIFPVPLTPEILERNFEKKTFYGIYDDYFDLDIREYSDSIYVATFHNCEMNTPDEQMTFSFVHELQHFLNHCCIEKEIEL